MAMRQIQFGSVKQLSPSNKILLGVFGVVLLLPIVALMLTLGILFWLMLSIRLLFKKAVYRLKLLGNSDVDGRRNVRVKK